MHFDKMLEKGPVGRTSVSELGGPPAALTLVVLPCLFTTSYLLLGGEALIGPSCLDLSISSCVLLLDSSEEGASIGILGFLMFKDGCVVALFPDVS